MKNKYKFILLSLILLSLVVSSGAVFADDLDTIQEGEVSGGVNIEGSNPGATTGELNYDIPEDIKDVDYAGLYINVYSGSAGTTYASETNVSLKSNGETEQIANEQLISTEGSTDGTVYTINDHTTKCYSDYMLTYNLTEKLQNASGQITFNVTNSKIEGYNFDGRIKLIGLVFAYNDGDNDKISYWVNSGQSWVNGGDTTKATFNVGTIKSEISNATLDNFALSSNDGLYSLNNEYLEESLIYDDGDFYYKYHKWDVLNKIINGTNTLIYTPNGGSFKNVLSVLAIGRENNPSVNAKLSSEYSGAVFAGTYNVLKLNLINDGVIKSTYLVDLYADGVKVNK